MTHGPPDATTVRLRRADLSDAEEIARLHIASWRAAYRAELPAAFLDALKESERAEQWRTRLAVSSTVVMLAQRDGVVAGFCAHGPAHNAAADPTSAWEIYSLHVTPERRGTGIGSILFADGRASALRAGARELRLWVVATNAPARRFYESKAMQPDGAEKQRELTKGVVLHEVRYSGTLALT